jgi:hypothetical protein
MLTPGRALSDSCKGCDKAIHEGAIRLGRCVRAEHALDSRGPSRGLTFARLAHSPSHSISDPDKSAHGHGQAYWKHHECVTAKQMQNIDLQGGIAAIDGFATLKQTDRAKLEKLAKDLRGEAEAKLKAKADELAAKEERKRERAENAEKKRQEKAEAKAAREAARAEAKEAKAKQKKRKAEEMEAA